MLRVELSLLLLLHWLRFERLLWHLRGDKVRIGQLVANHFTSDALLATTLRGSMVVIRLILLRFAVLVFFWNRVYVVH